MVIIISPAKKLDLKTNSKIKRYSTPAFLDKSGILIEELRRFAPTDLAVLMNVSDDIANLTFERYSLWKAPFDSEDALQAILSFKGDVYRGLEAESLSGRDMDFAQDHLRIISGLYGMLRPLDLMQPYRLEMGLKLKFAGNKSLYEFWSGTITAALNSDLANAGSGTLINLASQEYSKVIDKDKLEGEIVTPVFKEYRGDNYKVLGIHAKKARGMMSRFIIKNRITDSQEIKLFNLDGYCYDENLSTPEEWVFTR